MKEVRQIDYKEVQLLKMYFAFPEIDRTRTGSNDDKLPCKDFSTLLEHTRRQRGLGQHTHGDKQGEQHTLRERREHTHTERGGLINQVTSTTKDG